MNRCFSISSTICLCLAIAIATAAQNQPSATPTSSSQLSVPHLVKFSGTVKDDTGHPRSGFVGITFALYKDQQGGAPLWLETQSVQADSRGNYTVLLGSSKAEGLPTDIFTSNDARWLGVQVEGQNEQSRTLLVSAPYALKAADAETLGGKPLSAFQLAAPESSNNSTQKPLPAADQTNEITCVGGTACKTGFIPEFSSNGGSAKVTDSIIRQSGSTVTVAGSQNVTGNVGIGVAPGNFPLQIKGPTQLGVLVQGPASGVGTDIDLQTTGTGGKAWEILATGKTSAQGPGKLNIRDLSTGSDVFTMAPGGLVGIGNTNPGTVLQVTDNNVTGTSVGTVFAADAFKVGTAVFGDVTATSGLTNGVVGQILSSTTGSHGVEGEAQSSTGLTAGVAGFTVSSTKFSAGVVGGSDPSGGAGATVGVLGSTSSTHGTGVLGSSSAISATGNGLIGCCSAGVWGDTGSNVFGDTALAGTADDARAIFLQNNSTHVPTAIAVNVETSQQNLPALVAGGNAAGSFKSCTVDTNGNLTCNGTITPGVVAVANGTRQVALYSMGAAQNWFEDFGSGRLAGGVATVALEPTFAQTVNTASDFHVFLTPEGDCRGLYVSNKSASGFEVRELGGGQSNVTFDFRIVALRLGYENVRLEDKTEMMAKLKAGIPQPSATPGPRFTMPTPSPAPIAAPKANTVTPVALGPQR